MDDSSCLELVGAPASLSFPDLCANCGHAASDRLLVERRFPVRPHGSPRGFRRIAVHVPFCRACVAAHRRQLPRLSLGAYLKAFFHASALLPALASAAAAVLVGLRIETLRLDQKQGTLIALTVFFALTSLLCLRAASRQLRVWTIRPTQVTESFLFSRDLSRGFERERHSYTLRNIGFAAAFESSNAGRRWDRTSRSTRWSASLRNLVFAVIALAALGWWLVTVGESWSHVAPP
jgi:hypothetical protein